MENKAPTYASLLKLRRPPDAAEIALPIEVVTPILGGSPQTRTIDAVDIIRAATIRGHLRLWWRALYAHQYDCPTALYKDESERWGRAADEHGGRSAVELCVHVTHPGQVDTTDIQLYDSKEAKATVGAYALWPAREDKKKGLATAPRRRPGTRFCLTLRVPARYEAEIRATLRAWLLFGGYGSRTRRGLGSFKLIEAADKWLPKMPDKEEDQGKGLREAFRSLFGRDIFAAPGKSPTDVPWLAGATLHIGKAVPEAEKAWTTALDWLRRFRQGTDGPPGQRAREPGTGKTQPNRPSISNWPEADKVRHLTGKTQSHRPRHNRTPVWPRAGFGLPIIGQFQKQGRNGKHYDEPDGFELRWRRQQGDKEEYDRLASPLIVKALPLANGQFVPCVLWLNRAYPPGEVFLRSVANSAAPFDQLVAPGDTPQFSVLDGKQSLREAFFDWLRAKHQTTVVAP
ncbi:type III-B CRISPR module RAMP protein Cmr1 [Chloracidobacterium sp. D]|uniref:type III-B CRISPR module RAMP protein Cmr1 n=1 Tax=Chloracidobacterium sp. D TaxID=2821536 RepID=UPI001B8B8C02|nr:type III-B CRISPR module RAMP protein Cmr1 [Chloracidobacterium sp. D]QUV81922.1 type III-B CRISPR module RAMP protein Cmr1 [Chloracidobacterium sp. D]